MHSDDYDDADGDNAMPPIALLARLFDARGWTYDSGGDDEIVATIAGSWTSYEIRLIWRQDDQVLQMLAFPDIRANDDKRSVAAETLTLINEQLWLGHFEMWSTSGTVVFRHGVLVGDAGLSHTMAETLVDTMLDECDRFYPVFQFVLWGGKSPSEALAASMIETRGEA